MDGRFLVLGSVLLGASLGVHAAGWSQSLWAWGIPFALILLFLALVGQGPGGAAAAYMAAANTEGRPSERPARGGAAGHPSSR